MKSSRSGTWFAPFRPERRIGEHDVEPAAVWHLVDRIASSDVRLETVKIQVHQSKPARPVHEILAKIRRFLYALRQRTVHRAALRLCG